MDESNPSKPGFIEDNHRDAMNSVAQELGDIFKGYGFALFVFEFGSPTEDSRFNWISNASRPEMIEALEEFIRNAKADTGPEVRHPRVN